MLYQKLGCAVGHVDIASDACFGLLTGLTVKKRQAAYLLQLQAAQRNPMAVAQAGALALAFACLLKSGPMPHFHLRVPVACQVCVVTIQNICCIISDERLTVSRVPDLCEVWCAHH